MTFDETAMGEPRWLIRRGRPDDAPGLADLRWRWRAGERGEVGLSEPDFGTELSRWIRKHEQSHLPFVAEGSGPEGEPASDGPSIGHRLVGMAWLALVERVPGPGVWERRSGYVQSVYVAIDARRAGIGAALVEAVVAEARLRRLDYLAVHPSEVSFDLYRRAGFAPSGKVLELDLRPGPGASAPPDPVS